MTSKVLFELEIIDLSDVNLDLKSHENLFIAVQDISKLATIKYESTKDNNTNQALNLIIDNLNVPIIISLYHLSDNDNEAIKYCIGYCELSVNDCDDGPLTLELINDKETIASLQCVIKLENIALQGDGEDESYNTNNDEQYDYNVFDELSMYFDVSELITNNTNNATKHSKK